jgi:hypothetical protein
MKKVFVALFAVAAATAQAVQGRIPTLPSPPPYGAYFLDQFGGQDAKDYNASLQAIVEHYGYKNRNEAQQACIQARFPNCAADVVAHKHAQEPEVKKYGFASWQDAVYACSKNFKKDYGPVTYCFADPFLKLRLGTK